jgi:transposase-like protein
MGNLPAELSSGTSKVIFGQGVKAACVAISAGGLVPPRVAARLCSEIFGVRVAHASVASWISELAASLDGFDQTCVELLRSSPVLGADETGLKVAGSQSYAHVAVNDYITRFHLGTRSAASIEAGGILNGYKGTVVSDCYSPYWSITSGTHQACLAHLIRELRFFVEVLPADFVARAGLGGLALVLSSAVRGDRSNVVALKTSTTKAVARALLVIQDAKSKKAASKTERDCAALLNRILRLSRAGDLYGFVNDESIPPTNNASERALRPLKVKQKRSGGFRSEQGAREHLRIAGYLDTARKGGVDPLAALRMALQGVPLMPRAQVLV